MKKGGRVLERAYLQHILQDTWQEKKALGKGAKGAILYTGTKKYTQRMAAALKGVIDAGVEVPADSKTFPPDERINGEHLTVKNDISKVKSAIDSEVK